ncbi:hypothetical protein GC197_00475 [bacterium]|nr:hypothetical protein [bacterium]
MNAALAKLVERMPPPAKPKEAVVDWSLVEDALGFSYPASFKEFISIYGHSTWFDHAKPVYTTARSSKEVQKFIAAMEEKVSTLRGNTFVFDEKKGKRVQKDLPLFPEKGGLFPFMNDFSGSFYCWQTKSQNPEKWPVVCCFSSQVLIIKNITVPQMFLEWLERKPRMVDLWGDVNDLSPDQIQLS